MKCPYCEVHIDNHEALDCLNLWVMKDVFGWTTSISPYKGDFYPKGSYFVNWHQPDDFMPKTLFIVSQAFDKDGNNLRSTEENPFGMWEEGPSNVVPFFYCTRIADAWLVVEKMNGDGYIVEIVNDLVAWSVCFIHADGDVKYTADWKQPLEAQICLAALKAMENK